MGALNDLADAANRNSAAHGFWDDLPDATEDGAARATYYGNKLMLIVGEVSEAHEELRKNTSPTHIYYSYKPVPPSLAAEFPSGADAKAAWESTQTPKPEGLPYELADVLVRMFDLAGHLGIDLDLLVNRKMGYNATRPPKHNKAF